MKCRWLLLLSVFHLARAQIQPLNRYVVNQEGSSVSPAPRQSLRPRFSALTPSQLLQRANAARDTPGNIEENPMDTEKSAKLIEKLLQSSPPVIVPADFNPNTQAVIIEEQQDESPENIVREQHKETEDNLESSSTVPDRSYRKQYSTGRRRQSNNNEATNLKELLKQSGTLSLSEILQQKNLSLSDLLQGKKMAISALKEKQSSENKLPISSTTTTTTTASPEPLFQRHPVYNEVSERMYYTTTKRTPILFNTNQRSSYLLNKRTSTSPAPAVFRTETRRWPSNAEPDYDTTKGDSREDILDLLQPGSPVSLAQLLSSRNMTLAELMEHRERGSRQQALVDLFSNLIQNTTRVSPVKSVVMVSNEPSLRKSSQQVVISSVSPSRPRSSRDPRLLDLIRGPVMSDIDQDEELEEKRAGIQEPDHYEYPEDEEEEEEQSLPVGVKSAILASGGLLGLALVLFAAIFLCCRIHQRRRRGTRLPFLRNAKLSKSERNVVIKPAQNKQLSHINQMDDF